MATPILKKGGNKAALRGETADAPKSGGGFGSIWKKASSAPSFGLPVGVHETFLTGSGQQEKETGAFVVYFEYTVVKDQKLVGRSGRCFYNVLTADEEQDRGMEYLKRDMALLGFEEEMDNVDSKQDLLDLMEHISQQKLWVIIEAKIRNSFLNLFIQDVPDQDDAPIDEYPVK